MNGTKSGKHCEDIRIFLFASDLDVRMFICEILSLLVDKKKHLASFPICARCNKMHVSAEELKVLIMSSPQKFESPVIEEKK